MNLKGSLLASSGKSSDAVQMLTAGIAAWRSTGATLWLPFILSCLAKAYADLGQFGDATRTINEATAAVEMTKERWCEAEIHRLAAEIALRSPGPDPVKARTHFETALAVARKQQAKSFELRAAMSMARLWRDQGETRRGPLSACPRIWLVHRRVRHARPERGQGAARRTWISVCADVASRSTCG